jgi:hypothetical protein
MLTEFNAQKEITTKDLCERLEMGHSRFNLCLPNVQAHVPLYGSTRLMKINTAPDHLPGVEEVIPAVKNDLWNYKDITSMQCRSNTSAYMALHQRLNPLSLVLCELLENSMNDVALEHIFQKSEFS